MRGQLRIVVCLVALSFAILPACAQDRAAAAFWRGVQARCDATAAKPPSDLGKKIAQSALDEFAHFGGHQIAADGRLATFGLIGGENEKREGALPNFGRLAWWRVMTYWKTLYPADAGDRLEVRGFAGASDAAKDGDKGDLISTTTSRLLKAAEAETDAETREVMRELAWRSAALDTPWSAAFISYVVKQAGVPADAFQYSNAHRAYIYGAFAVSAAEADKAAATHVYRACPVLATRARPGDLICDHREFALADNEPAMRERIRRELASGEARSVRRTHCEVVTHVDARGRRMYTIGGNVLQGVAARTLRLRGNGRLAAQKSNCAAKALPNKPAELSQLSQNCSLSDKKWLVLLQLR